jgi:hypothetical protein
MVCRYFDPKSEYTTSSFKTPGFLLSLYGTEDVVYGMEIGISETSLLIDGAGWCGGSGFILKYGNMVK